MALTLVRAELRALDETRRAAIEMLREAEAKEAEWEEKLDVEG